MAQHLIAAIRTDQAGIPLAPGSPPPPRQPADAMPSNPWHPFPDRFAFEFAKHHFSELQSSETQINWALDHWMAERIRCQGRVEDLPWTKAQDMYNTIDSIKEGPSAWRTVNFCFTGPRPQETPPKWMLQTYELVFRNAQTILLDQISRPKLDGHFDYSPYIQFDEKGQRVWSNLMSGTWAWDEAVRLYFTICGYSLIAMNSTSVTDHL
jgi:Plavaka transposase